MRGKNVVVSAIYHINGSSHQKTSLRFILPEMARRYVLIFSGEISSPKTQTVDKKLFSPEGGE